MASAKMRPPQISLPPLFGNAVDRASSSLDKARRATLPAQPPPHQKSASSSNRIDKHPLPSRKRRERASPGLGQKFADAIEDTREEIRKAANDVLTRVEHEATVELARVAEDFEEKLQLVIDYETRAFQSIANERLLITTTCPEKKTITKQEVVFGTRMEEFKHLVEREEAAIAALWREWEKVQIETVCLALEVLGPAEVALAEEEVLIIAREKVVGANQCYSEHKESLNEAVKEMAAIEISAKEVTSQTLKTLKEQQEALTAANKTAMNNMTRMLQELNA